MRPIATTWTRLTRDLSRNELWLLSGILLLAALLRFGTLNRQGMWYDEMLTVTDVHGGLKHMLASVPLNENNPPLYYILAWGWARVVGGGPVALRSLSALLGVLTIPVLFVAGRMLHSTRAGLATAALATVSPMLVWYSQEARNYALLAFFASLAFVFFLRTLRVASPSNVLAWGCISAAALTTHYFAVYFVVAEAVWLLLARREAARYVLLTLTMLATVAIAFASSFATELHNGRWIPELPLAPRVRQLATQLLAGVSPPNPWLGFGALALFALALGYPLIRNTRRQLRCAVVPLGVAIATVVIPLVVAAFGQDSILSRNFISVSALLFVALGCVIAAWPSENAGLIALTVLCAVLLSIVIADGFDRSLQRIDYRDAIAALGSPRSGRLIVAQSEFYAEPAIYYSGGKVVYPGQTVRVNEIDYIRVRRVEGDRPCWAGAACALGDAPAPSAPPAEGFDLVSRRTLAPMEIRIYRAPQPKAIELTALLARIPPEPLLGIRSLPLPPVLVLQRPSG